MHIKEYCSYNRRGTINVTNRLNVVSYLASLVYIFKQDILEVLGSNE